MLNVQATNTTAVVAGIITAIGAIGYSLITQSDHSNLKLFVLPVFLIFIFGLWYFLILGKQYVAEAKFGLRALFRKSFYIEYRSAFIRILFWGLGAGIAIVPYILISEYKI